jgi:hypothetical protein
MPSTRCAQFVASWGRPIVSDDTATPHLPKTRLIGSPKRIYCTVAASACDSRRALVTGVIFTFPLHAIRTFVRDRAPLESPV